MILCKRVNLLYKSRCIVFVFCYVGNKNLINLKRVFFLPLSRDLNQQQQTVIITEAVFGGYLYLSIMLAWLCHKTELKVVKIYKFPLQLKVKTYTGERR